MIKSPAKRSPPHANGRSLHCCPISAVVVGTSAGGPSALKTLLSRLDPKLTAAVVVLNHIGPTGPDLLPEILAQFCPLPIRLAQERTPVESGVVHIAPSGYHLLVERDHTFSLSVDPKVHFSRPAIDVLFISAAAAYGPALAGLVMTGASRDGATGLSEIRKAGGYAMVQDPQEAAFATMPQSAIDISGAELCAPLIAIAERINRLARHD